MTKTKVMARMLIKIKPYSLKQNVKDFLVPIHFIA